MTTSRQTDWMDHPELRTLVDRANTLSLAERMTLVKGLMPGIADQLDVDDYDAFMDELRLKGARFHEAKSHPGQGRATREIPGERELEQR